MVGDDALDARFVVVGGVVEGEWWVGRRVEDVGCEPAGAAPATVVDEVAVAGARDGEELGGGGGEERVERDDGFAAAAAAGGRVGGGGWEGGEVLDGGGGVW